VVELAPADEDILRRLLRALAAAEDSAGVLAAPETWAANLARTLELEPSAETVAEIERIRASAISLPPAGRRIGLAPGAVPQTAATDEGVAAVAQAGSGARGGRCRATGSRRRRVEPRSFC